MNNLAPMKNCPGGVQGNLNWMPGYISPAGRGQLVKMLMSPTTQYIYIGSNFAYLCPVTGM